MLLHASWKSPGANFARPTCARASSTSCSGAEFRARILGGPVGRNRSIYTHVARLTPIRVWPAKLGQSWADVGSESSKFDQAWPEVDQFGTMWSEFGQFWLNFVPKSGRKCSMWGQNSPNIARIGRFPPTGAENNARRELLLSDS